MFNIYSDLLVTPQVELITGGCWSSLTLTFNWNVSERRLCYLVHPHWYKGGGQNNRNRCQYNTIQFNSSTKDFLQLGRHKLNIRTFMEEIHCWIRLTEFSQAFLINWTLSENRTSSTSAWASSCSSDTCWTKDSPTVSAAENTQSSGSTTCTNTTNTTAGLTAEEIRRKERKEGSMCCVFIHTWAVIIRGNISQRYICIYVYVQVYVYIGQCEYVHVFHLFIYLFGFLDFHEILWMLHLTQAMPRLYSYIRIGWYEGRFSVSLCMWPIQPTVADLSI